jgi:hypothetical protein
MDPQTILDTRNAGRGRGARPYVAAAAQAEHDERLARAAWTAARQRAATAARLAEVEGCPVAAPAGPGGER